MEAWITVMPIVAKLQNLKKKGLIQSYIHKMLSFNSDESEPRIFSLARLVTFPIQFEIKKLAKIWISFFD